MLYHQYFGKVDRRNSDIYHLLAYHCLDVAAVGKLLLDSKRQLGVDIAELLEIPSKQLETLFTFFIALHDLGKFASAFQLVSPKPELLSIIKRPKLYDAEKARHDRLAVAFWIKSEVKTALAKAVGIDEKTSKFSDVLELLLNPVFGHHGYPIDFSKGDLNKYIEPQNIEAVINYLDDLSKLLSPEVPRKWFNKIEVKKLEQVSWIFAGITTLADWIGSNSNYFPYCSQPMPLEQYWKLAQKQAERALKATDFFELPKTQKFISVKQHFGFEPTPLQHWAETVELSDQPQLFILEDITGSGKTEAALALTHRLMANGVADGFYFGLPTMATSNAMFNRIVEHYLQMYEEQSMPSIVLAHSAREMNQCFQQIKQDSFVLSNDQLSYFGQDLTATAVCNQWFTDNRKKALLAPVGVGTIDQVLLAVLAQKHQTLRLLGLYRKVLILDEIHTVDSYMLALLETLLTQHLRNGGSAILLTATLSQIERQKLVNVWLKAAQKPSVNLTKTGLMDFPLATQVSIDREQNVLEQNIASRSEVSREVGIAYLHTEIECINKIIETVEQKQCVVWIRNSVDEAISAYQQVIEHLREKELLASEDQVLLFHSRFTLEDRKRIENQVLSTFGKKDFDGQVIAGDVRQGKVLISTQVFQESLDADTDVMISDLCPIDDLIQRTGRLHRHTRDLTGCYYQGEDQRQQPILYIHSPIWQDNPVENWLEQFSLNTSYVYPSVGQLWLGLRKLRELGRIKMPDDARMLIEAVYSEQAKEQIPKVWENKEQEVDGKNLSKRASAELVKLNFDYPYSIYTNNFKFNDIEEFSTRYQDQIVKQVLLLKQNSSGEYQLWSDQAEHALALSVIKISEKKANQLQQLNQQQAAKIKQQYPSAKYLQLWLAVDDPKFTYSSVIGFHSR